MSFLELRILFEMLCDRLESGEYCHELHFEGGFGFELPQGALMIFVFQEGVFVCRLLARDPYGGLRNFTSPLNADECLEMYKSLSDCKGGFQELFSKEEVR